MTPEQAAAASAAAAKLTVGEKAQEVIRRLSDETLPRSYRLGAVVGEIEADRQRLENANASLRESVRQLAEQNRALTAKLEAK